MSVSSVRPVSVLSASVEGVGYWSRGLPDWAAARAYALGAHEVEGVPARPSPQLLAANERRRAPETVAVALEVAQAACHAAGRDPASLSSVFASNHGDMQITDYMCATLASEPRTRCTTPLPATGPSAPARCARRPRSARWKPASPKA
jgi:hypothetical protein